MRLTVLAIAMFVLSVFGVAQIPSPYEKAESTLNAELKKFNGGFWQIAQGGDFYCVHVTRNNLAGAKSADREILRDYIRVCRYGSWSSDAMLLTVAANLVRDNRWTPSDWKMRGFTIMQYVPLADGSYRASPACYGCSKQERAAEDCEIYYRKAKTFNVQNPRPAEGIIVETRLQDLQAMEAYATMYRACLEHRQ